MASSQLPNDTDETTVGECRIENKMGRISKIRVSVLWTMGVAALLAAVAGAQTLGTLEVTFEALEQIAIQEVRSLDFKRIVAPTSGSQTFTVDPDGKPSTATISGAGDGNFISRPQQGQVYVSGTDGEFFSISGLPVGTGTCTGAGLVGTVKLTAITVFPTRGILDRPVDIGGTLLVDSNAEGVARCPYTVTVAYQ